LTADFFVFNPSAFGDYSDNNQNENLFHDFNLLSRLSPRLMPEPAKSVSCEKAGGAEDLNAGAGGLGAR
jgi:hypothetical protein